MSGKCCYHLDNFNNFIKCTINEEIVYQHPMQTGKRAKTNNSNRFEICRICMWFAVWLRQWKSTNTTPIKHFSMNLISFKFNCIQKTLGIIAKQTSFYAHFFSIFDSIINFFFSSASAWNSNYGLAVCKMCSRIWHTQRTKKKQIDV